MSTEVIEKPKTAPPSSGVGDQWRVIVLNDNHNTFDGVASALSRTLPGVSLEAGHQMASRIDSQGMDIVWSGHKELAELYWDMLKSAGLTMAPLE